MTVDEAIGWFILRTAGRDTLPLAASLAEDGFEAWTPARKLAVRVPRMNVRREVRLPMLPSFVFVRTRHLHDILMLAKMPVKPRRLPAFKERHSRPAHRSFSVFRYLDQIPMIADADLDPLREKEMEVAPKREAPRFDRGARVKVKSGAFEGLKGRVERCKAGYALVIFTDWNRPVKMPASLLREDEANIAANVAKAA